MSLEIPDSATELDNKSKTDVQRELTGSNPFTRNHWLGAIISAFSNRVFDFYKQLLNGIDAVFPDTAFGNFLSRWLVIYRINQLAATGASGSIVATGTIGAQVTVGDKVSNSNGDLYTATSTVVLAATALTVNTLVRSGQVVTASFLNPHLLASGVSNTISGALESEYNGTFVITVISDNQFQYTIVGSPTTPGTGPIIATATTASVPFTSDETGASLNLDNAENVTLESPIAGVDNTLTVDFGAVGGGTNQEAIKNTQLRMVERIQNPVAHYNESDITTLAKTINGITRVFVQTPSTDTTSVTVNLTRLDDGTNTNVAALATIQSGNFPFFSGQEVTISLSDQSDYNLTDNAIITGLTTLIYSVGITAQDPVGTQATITGSDVPLGTTRVFFMRDNDFNNLGVRDPIPTASEVLALKTLLLTLLPANTSENDLVVSAPTPVPVAFSFNSISPDTLGMRTGIRTALEQLMFDRTLVGSNLDEDFYRAALTNSFNEASGLYIDAYDLVLTGDVTIASGEIPTLGVLDVGGDIF